ncbi:uncharacterized protein LOC113852232 [Abrus precatorius]|uniref:Uncharacterized protein LOC113852232 n=1 Tax=Abrus precatorius TaxID=3816 RepID=A0A8B8K3N3_ABRPR|nr:uncharacterized protein LOC113852232 [Abrus precatorius]
MVISYSIERCPCNHQPHFDHHLYDVDLHGTVFTVTVTASPFTADCWLNKTLNRNAAALSSGTLVAGLGVQWTPRADGLRIADTLQLCIGRRCLIFQISRATSSPFLLRDFLVEPGTCTFVGFWNRYDRQSLWESQLGLILGSDPIDLRSLLNQELAHASVETIVESFLGYSGVRTRIQVSLSNWGAFTLTDDQVLQASLNARCAYLIGHAVEAWRPR